MKSLDEHQTATLKHKHLPSSVWTPMSEHLRQVFTISCVTPHQDRLSHSKHQQLRATHRGQLKWSDDWQTLWLICSLRATHPPRRPIPSWGRERRSKRHPPLLFRTNTPGFHSVARALPCLHISERRIFVISCVRFLKHFLQTLDSSTAIEPRETRLLFHTHFKMDHYAAAQITNQVVSTASWLLGLDRVDIFPVEIQHDCFVLTSSETRCDEECTVTKKDDIYLKLRVFERVAGLWRPATGIAVMKILLELQLCKRDAMSA